jgi:hypothetical protein
MNLFLPLAPPQVPLDVFGDVSQAAETGCRQIHDILRSAVRDNTLRLLASRGTVANVL